MSERLECRTDGDIRIKGCPECDLIVKVEQLEVERDRVLEGVVDARNNGIAEGVEQAAKTQPQEPSGMRVGDLGWKAGWCRGVDDFRELAQAKACGSGGENPRWLRPAAQIVAEL